MINRIIGGILSNYRANANRKATVRKVERENQRIVRQLERYRQDWEAIMHGLAVRDCETEKSSEFDRFDSVLWGVSK